jgi:uncharacterized protein (TIGR02453 family)
MDNNNIKLLCDYLSRLKANNNKEWFYSNRKEYEEIRANFMEFAGKLITAVSKFDPEIKEANLTAKECTYRINRDLRFSKEKSPYKTHFGIFICKGGKKSQFSGYYLHLEPEASPSELENLNEYGFTSRSILCAGTYCPEPKVLKSIKDEISVNGETFIKALEKAKGYKPDYTTALKKVPRGFESVKPEWGELLRLKDFSIMKTIPQAVLYSSDFFDYAVRELKRTKDYVAVVNRAVQYAMEER